MHRKNMKESTAKHLSAKLSALIPKRHRQVARDGIRRALDIGDEELTWDQ